MRKPLLIAIAALLLSVAGLAAPEDAAKEAAEAAKDLWKKADLFFEPLPQEAINPDNELTAAKVDLGARLYFDTRLSKEGNISCNSCHDVARFGVDNEATSPGDAGERGDRNSPTTFNAALHIAQFWDGRAADVEEQAGMPVLNPVEMAIDNPAVVVDRLAADAEYPELFAAAFPQEEEPLTYTNVERAIGAFERTLITPSRFDTYLWGDLEALTTYEKKGLETFIGYGCVSCHNGVTLGGHIFRKFGLNERYWELTGSEKVDLGRFAVSGEEADKYVFKVASLRNVEMTGPYFHDGSVASLEEAVQVMARAQVGVELPEEALGPLIAFLHSLTGQVPISARRAAEEHGG